MSQMSLMVNIKEKDLLNHVSHESTESVCPISEVCSLSDADSSNTGALASHKETPVRQT